MLTQQEAARVLNKALCTGADFAELFSKTGRKAIYGGRRIRCPV